MKRILCIALTLLLGLTLLAPAVLAADGDPVFTAQAKASDGAIIAGNPLTLTAAATATVPEGGTLRIDWYGYNWQPGDDDKGDAYQAIATGANATYTVPVPELNLYWIDAPSQNLHLYAVAKNLNAEGEMVAYAKSGPVNVMVVQSFNKAFGDYLGELPGEGFLSWIMFLLRSLQGIPGMLLIALPSYVMAYILTLIL